MTSQCFTAPSHTTSKQVNSQVLLWLVLGGSHLFELHQKQQELCEMEEDVIGVLSLGTRMLKVPNKSAPKPEERLIRVDVPSMHLYWDSKKHKQPRGGTHSKLWKDLVL